MKSISQQSIAPTYFNAGLTPQKLTSLKESVKRDPSHHLRAVAQQFESMMIDLMMKNMRSGMSTFGGDDASSATKMYTDMADQHMSERVSSRGLGLADMLLRQMDPEQFAKHTVSTSRQLDQALSSRVREYVTQPIHQVFAPNQAMSKKQTAVPVTVAHSPKNVERSDSAQQLINLLSQQVLPMRASKQMNQMANSSAHQFTERVAEAAKAAENALGIPAKFLVAQAALESGWGKHEMVDRVSGVSSHNVFGIKAGPGWNGHTIETETTEWVNGKPQRVNAQFRAYASYEEAFADYAKLLRSNKRYANVIGANDADQFALHLQKAGYATDPLYAQKLQMVLRGPALANI